MLRDSKRRARVHYLQSLHYVVAFELACNKKDSMTLATWSVKHRKNNHYASKFGRKANGAQVPHYNHTHHAAHACKELQVGRHGTLNHVEGNVMDTLPKRCEAHM